MALLLFLIIIVCPPLVFGPILAKNVVVEVNFTKSADLVIPEFEVFLYRFIRWEESPSEQQLKFAPNCTECQGRVEFKNVPRHILESNYVTVELQLVVMDAQIGLYL